MADIGYQNIDTPNSNPLSPRVSLNQSAKPTLPKDPKIKLLLILVTIVVVLLILSLVVSLFRQQRPTKKTVSTITPIPKVSISPIQNNLNLPTQFIEKFNRIDNQITTEENFLPPSFDEQIGL